MEQYLYNQCIFHIYISVMLKFSNINCMLVCCNGIPYYLFNEISLDSTKHKERMEFEFRQVLIYLLHKYKSGDNIDKYIISEGELN